MSIIYDALKKVEDAKGSNNSGGVSVQPEPAAAPNKNQAKGDKSNIYVFLVILILLVSFLGTVYVNQIKVPKTSGSAWHKPKPKKTNIINQISNVVFPQPEQKTKKAAVSPQGASGSAAYNLEGIIFDNAQPVAIIDGTMLKKGDIIGDFQVSEITATSVELLNTKDNTKRTLSL
jgi:Na+-transporting methylmalonyl-CoA/oxaloacetate decarboxylase gamma subunit